MNTMQNVEIEEKEIGKEPDLTHMAVGYAPGNRWTEALRFGGIESVKK